MSILIIWLAVFFTIHLRNLYHIEQKEKEQLKSIVEYANEGILMIRQDGKIYSSNPAVEKIFGYKSIDILTKVIDELIPNFAIILKEYFKNISNPLSPRVGESLKCKRKDESEFYIDINLSYFHENGAIVWIVFILDVTDRVKNDELAKANLKMMHEYNQKLESEVKQRTEELARSNQKLISNQAIYHSIADNYPDGFIGVMDRSLKYVLVGGKGLSALGLDSKSIINDIIFDNIYQSMSVYAEKALVKVFDGKKVSFDIELKGDFYNVTAVPIESPGHPIQEILVVVKNISVHKNLEYELMKTLEKEKELNTLKSRFVTMASHEFRTPLTTILSSAFLVENYTGQQVENERKKHLERIKRAVNGLTELLNDFLSLGQLEEGKVHLMLKSMNLKVFCEDLIQEVSLTKKEGQKIVFEFEGEDTEIAMDKHLLRNILLNLLSNAIKYSPISSNIGLTISVASKNITLKVSDQGIGIPPDEQKLIFKRFFRAKNTIQIQGTGLGLNIVRRYVKLLTGKIFFESRLDKGTIFTVILPLKRTTELNQKT
ncbi:sensor histidine kinase [Chryseotalea sanaruensis]|nr:PAS domain-containing sensor histidine kinase [Chryseotalea sanaruensis]